MNTYRPHGSIAVSGAHSNGVSLAVLFALTMIQKDGTTGLPAKLASATSTLFLESQTVAVQVRLVSDRKLKLFQKKKALVTHVKMFSLWKSYKDKELSPIELLKALSLLIKGPVNK